MQDWKKIANNAGDKVDAELAAGLDRLAKKDLTGLFPVPADKAKVEGLIKAINASSSYNERVAAFKAVAAVLGADALKMLKGAMLALLVCLAFAPAARAQVVEPPAPVVQTTSLFDFGDFFANVRGGYAINQHQQLSTVFYTPWKVFHTKEKLPLASINLGYDGLQKRPLVAVGLRADNLDSLLWNGKWGKEHVTTAKLPSLEFGPFVSVWPVKTDKGYKLDVSYGAALAIGFSIGGR